MPRLRPRPSARQRRLRAVLVALAVTVIVGVLATGVAAWALLFRPATDIEPGTPVQVEVPAGAGTADIAGVLAEKGVVSNPNMFRLQSRQAGADGKLRAGVYELSTGMPYDLVITKLMAGPPIKYVTVTIPEGFTLDQIAARLEKQVGIPSKEFLAIAKGGAKTLVAERPYLKGVYKGLLEGYLFPKTYRFREGTDARGAIDIMLDQFEKEIAQVDLDGAEARGDSLTEVVIMASMIERETRVDTERALVSSVIHNRLQKGMRLEIDATIEYVLPGNRFRLKYSDLKIDSPYNTYRVKGLPAGPISNPGLESLKAAAAPADTDFIYYVLTGKDGTHTFADNTADFLTAKRKSKEVFGK